MMGEDPLPPEDFGALLRRIRQPRFAEKPSTSSLLILGQEPFENTESFIAKFSLITEYPLDGLTPS